MKLTRRKSEERKQALLQYFLANPDATGDEAQALLVSGKLTGEKGPQLSTGVLYELRKRAATMRPVGMAAGPQATSDELARLREKVAEVQRLLAVMPSVPSVTVTKDSARIERTREEPL